MLPREIISKLNREVEAQLPDNYHSVVLAVPMGPEGLVQWETVIPKAHLITLFDTLSQALKQNRDLPPFESN